MLALWNEQLCMMLPEAAEESEGFDGPANADGEDPFRRFGLTLCLSARS